MTDPVVTPSESIPEPVIKAGAIYGTLTTFVVTILGVLVAVGKMSAVESAEITNGLTAIGGYLPALVGSIVGIVGIVAGIASHLTTSLVARRKVTPARKATR